MKIIHDGIDYQIMESKTISYHLFHKSTITEKKPLGVFPSYAEAVRKMVHHMDEKDQMEVKKP